MRAASLPDHMATVSIPSHITEGIVMENVVGDRASSPVGRGSAEALAALEIKLAAAVGPDRELEQDIWHALGLCQPVRINGEVAGCADYHAPRYTTSIDAALMLVPEGRTWNLGRWIGLMNGVSDSTVYWFDFHGSEEQQARCPTAPLAICLAAIRARRASYGS